MKPIPALRLLLSLSIVLATVILPFVSAHAATRDEVVYYVNDPLGSAVAAYDENGEQCWGETYTPYGYKTEREDSFNRVGCGVISEERGYTGHTEDWETDLVYMQQRYYDPTIGRFLSLDPISPVANDPRTLNRYSYAANNPYKYVDPTGEIFFVPVVAFLAKEVIAEVASHYTNGATDILSVRRMATKAVKYGAKSLATKKADDVVEKSTDVGGDVPKGGTFRDANARLRNADGTFAPDGGKARNSGGSHGNTAGDQPATLYERYDADGNFLKHGISQNPSRRYTQKELDGGYLVETQRGPRRQMLNEERNLVETNPGPLNKEPWAGSRSN